MLLHPGGLPPPHCTTSNVLVTVSTAKADLEVEKQNNLWNGISNPNQRVPLLTLWSAVL
jgi:hypothetical protein